MKEIRVLEQTTIDKIAAGEVVERPGSIVKELCENALDAGASAITVEIRDGGTSMIRVTDNGEGIDPSQIRSAFQRHATSKITQVDDLVRIQSFGFRGEAERLKLIRKPGDVREVTADAASREDRFDTERGAAALPGPYAVWEKTGDGVYQAKI